MTDGIPATLVPWDFAPIRTERLLLRPMTVGDVDDVHAYQGREDVATYLLSPPRTREEVAERMPDYAAHLRLERDGDWVQPAIEVDGRVVGQLFLRLDGVANLGAEIGWTLHPDVFGRGYATEGAAALLGVAFAAMGLHRVRAELDPRNAASIAVCRRLGMREEGLQRRDILVRGRWEDTGVWAILEDEWRGWSRDLAEGETTPAPTPRLEP